MPDEPLDIRQIFDRAVEMASDAERRAYLDDVCAADPAARRKLDSLLAAHAAAGSFLESPLDPAATFAGDEITEKPGLTVDQYKLLEQIGEGGMGVVFMAEQTEPVHRRVALKVIKPGMDTRQVIARFEAERQALAMMDHPNIARVLDGGTTESGRPYFVMELVKGAPITQYCDDKHLTPRQRLELLRPVCQAIEHAHQKGIIHRDIKPTNILVAEYDDQPIPKVIDFGVAKAIGQSLTEKTMFTGFGQLVGTLEYMSPEQAKVNQLDIDTRSDIYSLGVLMYELLTGSTPHDKQRLRSAAFDEMLRIIREEEPARPSTRLSSSDTLLSVSANRSMEPARLSRTVRGELDWIVMKALEKDRTRRYETASGFAQDVQRYLADEPVQACPPSASYRFRKFARRNKGPVLAASAIVATLLLLVVGLAVSNHLIAEERDQKAKALVEKEQALVQKQLALDHAEAERQRAARNFLKARLAISAILSEAGFGFGDWNNMPPSLRRRFSQGTINFYQSLLEEQGDDPSLQYENAVAYRDLSRVHRSWKEYPEAEECIRQSIAILGSLVKEYPERHDYRHQLAFSHFIVGSVLAMANRPAEAEAALLRAVDLYEEMILSKGPYNYLCTEIIQCYTPLIRLQKRGGALEDAERTARRLSLLPVPAYRHTEFASMLYTQGLIDESSKQYEEAIRQHEKAMRLMADDPQAFNSFAWLLVTCPVTQLRDAERAVELAGKAVKLAPAERSNWNTLGVARYRAGDWNAAIDALEKSKEFGKGGDSNDWFFLAMAHWQLGEKAKAREYFDRAVQWMDKNLERGHGLPQGRELPRFHAEAAGLLGVQDKKD